MAIIKIIFRIRTLSIDLLPIFQKRLLCVWNPYISTMIKWVTSRWSKVLKAHSTLLQALYLLEFLELNGLLGVTHFTLYNHTIGPKASCVLNHYINGKIPQHFQINSNPHSIKNEIGDSSVKTENITRPKITVNLLPWNLRMRSQKEIRTEGLFASLNDCLYRSMYRLGKANRFW